MQCGTPDLSVLGGLLVGLLGLSLLGSAYSLHVQISEQQPASSSDNLPGEKKKAAAVPPGDAAWEILRDALAGDDASKKVEAISALSVARPRTPVIKLIESFLSNKDSSVRQAAVVTLGELRSRRSIPKLRQALDDDSAEVSFTAARILWEMGDTSGRIVLIQVLAGERGASENLAQGKLREMKKNFVTQQPWVVRGRIPVEGFPCRHGLAILAADKDRNVLCIQRMPGSAAVPGPQVIVVDFDQFAFLAGASRKDLAVNDPVPCHCAWFP